MITARRYLQAAIVVMAPLLFVQETMAMTKFASDEVATAAKVPAAAEALAARGKLDEAFAAQDVDAVAALFAKDLVVNTPANRVGRLEQVLGFFKAGRMNYESADVTIEALDTRKDQVVIMGDGRVVDRRGGLGGGTWHQRGRDEQSRAQADGDGR